MADLNKNLGTISPDDLVIGTIPRVDYRGRTIRKLGTAGTIKRGTIMARSTGSAGDGKLVILGTTAETNETLVPDCIIADDVEVGTTADVKVAAYVSGNFNLNKCIVADNYTITDADLDELRQRNIMFRKALPY